MPEADAARAADKNRAAEELTRRVMDRLDAEARGLHRERFAQEGIDAIRQRLLDAPRARAEAIVASLRDLVASDRQEWVKRLDKQTRDIIDAMRVELARMELERLPSSARTRVIARSGFRTRFEKWSDAAMDAWSSHLSSLVDARYQELLAFELDQLESVLGARVDAVTVHASLPELRVRIAETSYESTYDPPSLGASVLGPFKGGLDVVALLAGLIVVPVVGTLMDQASLYARVGVVGAMVLLSLLASVSSGLRARRKQEAEGLAAARASIRSAVESSFVAQVERLRTDLERRTVAAVREGLRGTLASATVAIAEMLKSREPTAIVVLADAQANLERIDDRLRAIRALKYALEDELLVRLRRARDVE